VSDPAEQPAVPHDPIRAQRAKWAKGAEIGQRVGYLLFLVAVVAFFVGLVVGWSDGFSTTIIFCLVGGSVFLAPAIVVGYAVKAAEREDREAGR
jgi:hypothetical protein